MLIQEDKRGLVSEKFYAFEGNSVVRSRGGPVRSGVSAKGKRHKAS